MNKTALCCLLSMITFLLSCEYRPFETRLEIKNPAKAHTFKFYIDPKRHPSYYFSQIHGELDGNAQIRRYDKYKPTGPNDILTTYEISCYDLEKGKVFIGDTSDYYGGEVIIKYTPNGAKKGRLFIDIRVPDFP